MSLSSLHSDLLSILISASLRTFSWFRFRNRRIVLSCIFWILVKIQEFVTNRNYSPPNVYSMRLWYSEVEKENVVEIENFSSLVARHEGLILNYFVNGDTNAIAEATNSKIQRMITLNKGTKNKEFFWHKMKKIFNSTSKWDWAKTVVN